MSFIAGQFQRGDSTHSISSREGSAIASDHTVESGIYMTSFAATIFLAALTTFGVLLLTLLIALFVMLESCQSKSAGLIKNEKLCKEYEYCKIFAMHVEINSLQASEIPVICKLRAIQYVEDGQYFQELNFTLGMSESYFSAFNPNKDGLDVVLMDLDDIFSSFLPFHAHHQTVHQYRSNINSEGEHAHMMQSSMHRSFLQLHQKLQTSGWSVVFFTVKPEEERNNAIQRIGSAGFVGWSFLIMRSKDEIGAESWEFLSKRRAELDNKGFRIKSVISSHLYALTGPKLGERNFKLPSLMYFQKEHSIWQGGMQNTVTANHAIFRK